MIELFWMERNEQGADVLAKLVVRMQGVAASEENVRLVLGALQRIQKRLKPPGTFNLTDFAKRPVVHCTLDAYLEFIAPWPSGAENEPIIIDNPNDGMEFPMSGTVPPQ